MEDFVGVEAVDISCPDHLKSSTNFITHIKITNVFHVKLILLFIDQSCWWHFPPFRDLIFMTCWHQLSRNES